MNKGYITPAIVQQEVADDVLLADSPQLSNDYSDPSQPILSKEGDAIKYESFFDTEE